LSDDSEVKPFQIEKTIIGDVTSLSISGDFGEFAHLPELLPCKTLKIFLGDVTGFSSVGTRIWCEWGRSLRLVNEVVLDECPVLFVKSFSQVKGALQSNMRVNSFRVPYISEDYSERKDVLFVLGHQYDLQGSLRLPKVTGADGKPMEPDVVPELYFKFLRVK
jgi:hypothetical protein